MTAAERLGEVLESAGRAELTPDLRERLALHVFDTVGALLAGRRVGEAGRLSAVFGIAAGKSPSPGTEIMIACATVRCTEIDDIHLPGCVTPSSVIVPSAVLAAHDAGVTDGDAILRACLAGYEAILRFGRAVNGPGILYRGIWPTYLSAGMGAAAVAGSLRGFSAERFAHALVIAAGMAAGLNARGTEPSAKWLMVGNAARNGLLAAQASEGGFNADPGLLDGGWEKTTGIALDTNILGAPVDGHWQAEEISFKPWCAARQSITATAAFMELLAETGADPEALDEVRVEVPSAYRGMIDKPGAPAARQDSFADLRYALGLAAFAPEGLFDIRRSPPRTDSRMAALAGKVTIAADEGLAVHYPAHWPARVTIGGAGVSESRELIHAPGDPERPPGWDGVQDKLARALGPEAEILAPLRDACRALADGGDVRSFFDALRRAGLVAPAH